MVCTTAGSLRGTNCALRFHPGFAGASHAGSDTADQLRAAGARDVITDLRALKSTIIDLRGW
jgi:hypothetical protein